MTKARIAKIAAAFALLLALPASASAAGGVKVGVLDCQVAGGAGFIIGSTKDLTCIFTPSKGPREMYAGVVQKFGLDIGVTGTTLIKWLVLAPAANAYRPGALAGDYVGASAEATVFVGLGANRSFALQPVSVQAQEGLNLAVGFTSFRLRSPAG